MDRRAAVWPGDRDFSRLLFTTLPLDSSKQQKPRYGGLAASDLLHTPELSRGRRGMAAQKGLRNDPACLSYLLFRTKGPEAPAASGGQRKGRNNGWLGYRCSLQRNQRGKAAKPP